MQKKQLSQSIKEKKGICKKSILNAYLQKKNFFSIFDQKLCFFYKISLESLNSLGIKIYLS